MASSPHETDRTRCEAALAAPGRLRKTSAVAHGADADADHVCVMDLGSLSAADSSASLNARRRSHTRSDTARYVSAWQSQQVLDNLSKKILSSMGSSAARSTRDAHSRIVSGLSTSAATGPEAESQQSATDHARTTRGVALTSPSTMHTLRDVNNGVASAKSIPGFPGIGRMALKLAGTAQKDTVTRIAMSAFQRWRRLLLMRASQGSVDALQQSTVRENTVSSLFASAGARSQQASAPRAGEFTSSSGAAPRLPVWHEPTQGLSAAADSSPLAAGSDQKPPARAGRPRSAENLVISTASASGFSNSSVSNPNAPTTTHTNATSSSANVVGAGAVSLGTQRRVTPRGAVLLNSHSDYLEAMEERAPSSNLATLSLNPSGDLSSVDRAAVSAPAHSGLVSPTQPMLSLVGVHSRRATPSQPLVSPSQNSRSCSARSGPSIAVGDDMTDDFHRRWEEEGLSMSDRLEDFMSIEEDHRCSVAEKEQRRRTRLLARYTRASDAIFMDALRASGGSRLHPSLTSSAANPSLDVNDTPSDDNVSFWAAVSIGVGYNHPADNISGSSFPFNNNGSEAPLSSRSAGRVEGGAGVGTGASSQGQGPHSHLAVPQAVSQRAPQAPLPLAPTPGQSPRRAAAASHGTVPPASAASTVHTVSTSTASPVVSCTHSKPSPATEHVLTDPATATAHDTTTRRSVDRHPTSLTDAAHKSGHNTTGPLEDLLTPEPAKLVPSSNTRSLNHSSSEAPPAAGSEDGLEDVTLSAVTISCNNSLNSTRNNVTGTCAVHAPVSAASSPSSKGEAGRVEVQVPAPPVEATSVVRKAPLSSVTATTAAAHELPSHASVHTDEEELISSSTLRTAVTTKQPPRSLHASLTNRRVRPFVEKPQSEARHELEEAVKLGEEAGTDEPTVEAENAVVRGAQAVEAQQRRYLRASVASPMCAEDCATTAPVSSAQTPTSTSVVARRCRDSGLSFHKGEGADHNESHTNSSSGPSLFPRPATSQRVSLATSSPAVSTFAEVSTGNTQSLQRDTYQELIRAPERVARHAIIIDYRAGLLDILRECHFLSN